MRQRILIFSITLMSLALASCSTSSDTKAWGESRQGNLYQECLSYDKQCEEFYKLRLELLSERRETYESIENINRLIIETTLGSIPCCFALEVRTHSIR
jgi:hypothetical protein